MNENRNDTSKSDDISLIVRSDWSVGPRTAAWDRLWREVLGRLEAQPTTDALEALGQEAGDA